MNHARTMCFLVKLHAQEPMRTFNLLHSKSGMLHVRLLVCRCNYVFQSTFVSRSSPVKAFGLAATRAPFSRRFSPAASTFFGATLKRGGGVHPLTSWRLVARRAHHQRVVWERPGEHKLAHRRVGTLVVLARVLFPRATRPPTPPLGTGTPTPVPTATPGASTTTIPTTGPTASRPPTAT